MIYQMATETNRPSIAALDEAARRSGLIDWANVTSQFLSGQVLRRTIIAHAWTIQAEAAHLLQAPEQ